MDETFGRRAREALAAGQGTERDLLEAGLSPAAASAEVAGESLEELEARFPSWKDKGADACMQDLQKQRKRVAGLKPGLADNGKKLWLTLARLERLVQLKREEEAQQQRRRQQQERQQQEQQPSGAWLERAVANQEEAHAGQLRKVAPRPVVHAGRDSRQFGGLEPWHDRGDLTNNVPQASRGAPTVTQRALQLLKASHAKPRAQQRGSGGQQRQAAGGGERGTCQACGKLVKLRPAWARDVAEVVQACDDCIASDNLEPREPCHLRQPTVEESLHKQRQQQQQLGGRRAAAAAPAAAGMRPLAVVSSSAFHGAGKAAAQPGRAAQAPRRGKGARKGFRSDSGSDYEPDAEAERQRRADAAEEEEGDSVGLPGRKRPRQRARRGKGASQAGAEAEPEEVDLLSDEDGEVGQPSGGSAAAGAAGGRPARATRAKAYRPTSDRFKGLSCRYPPEGGPGAVELTALDLARLDPDEFLNDSVIDLYIRWLQDRLPPEVAKRCYFFNTFFFKKLAEAQGGALSPELEAWAERAGIVGSKLQALRNHQKVKKWTKDVDLFGKDYVFVPVHEALHWSLLVVCHPGELMPKEEARKAPNAKTPCILHLDSLAGSHRGAPLANKLRLYLEFEWHIKSLPNAPDGVPKRWAEDHPGQHREWKPAEFPCRTAQVPAQDNHCDCGLYMCAYTEYFVHRLPPAINVDDLKQLLDNHGKDNRDLFEGTDHCVPGLLTDKWFDQANPTRLRNELRHLILQLVTEQLRLVDRSTGEWVPDSPLADEVRRELQQLASMAQYVRPEDWEAEGLRLKRERQAALQRAAREQEEKKAQRLQRQAAAAKSPAASAAAPHRQLLARAAERRLQPRGTPDLDDSLFASLRDVGADPDSGAKGFLDEGVARRQLGRLQRPAPALQPAPQGEVEGLMDEEAGARGGRDAEYSGFEVEIGTLSEEEAPELGGRHSSPAVEAAAAAAGGQGGQRRSATPELCAVPWPQRATLPAGLRGSSLPLRADGKKRAKKFLPQMTESEEERPAEEEHQQAEQPSPKRPRWRQQQVAAAGVTAEAAADPSEEDSELDFVDFAGNDPMQQLEEQSAGQAAPQQTVFPDSGAEEALAWDRVVGATAVLQARPWPQEPIAELQFAYPAEEGDLTVRLPFAADATTTSVRLLQEWLRCHECWLSSLRGIVDLGQIEAWQERQRGAADSRQQRSPAAGAAQQQRQEDDQRQQQQQRAGQGNGPATVTRTRGKRASKSGAATSEAAGVSVAVAISSPQQQQQQQRQAPAEEGNSKPLNIDGGLPSTQRLAGSKQQQPVWAPEGGWRGDADCHHAASQPALALAGGGARETPSKLGPVAQQMERLHLQPAPAPAPLTAAQAAAAQLQQQQQQRKGSQAAEGQRACTAAQPEPRHAACAAYAAPVTVKRAPEQRSSTKRKPARPVRRQPQEKGGAQPPPHQPPQQQLHPQPLQESVAQERPCKQQRVPQPPESEALQSSFSWNPHLMSDGGQQAAEVPPAEAPPVRVHHRPRPSPAGTPAADPWHIRMTKGRPTQPAGAQHCGGTGQLGKPAASMPSFAVLDGQRASQRSSPRLTPPPGAAGESASQEQRQREVAAAAHAADAEAAACHTLSLRRQQRQAPTLVPAQVKLALQHANGGAMDGQLVKQLGAAVGSQQRLLAAQRQAAALSRLQRRQLSAASLRAADAVVDLASEDD